MRKLITLLLLISLTYSYSQERIYKRGFRTSAIVKSEQKNATNYLQSKFNNPFTYSIPKGFYYVDTTLVLNHSIDFNNSVIYTDKNIDVIYIRGNEFTIQNLRINTELCKAPTPDKTMITLQHNRVLMQYWYLKNIYLQGNRAAIWQRENVGHTGIKFDSYTDINGKLKGNQFGENHWSKIEVFKFNGLNNVLMLSKDYNDSMVKDSTDRLLASRFEIFLQGSLIKKIAVIDGVNGVNLRVKYNDTPSLQEEEKDVELIRLNSDRNSIYMEVVDFKRTSKTWESLNLTKYYHRFAVHNYGKGNIILSGSTIGLPIKEMNKDTRVKMIIK